MLQDNQRRRCCDIQFVVMIACAPLVPPSSVPLNKAFSVAPSNWQTARGVLEKKQTWACSLSLLTHKPFFFFKPGENYFVLCVAFESVVTKVKLKRPPLFTLHVRSGMSMPISVAGRLCLGFLAAAAAGRSVGQTSVLSNYVIPSFRRICRGFNLLWGTRYPGSYQGS